MFCVTHDYVAKLGAKWDLNLRNIGRLLDSMRLTKEHTRIGKQAQCTQWDNVTNMI